MRRRPPGSTRTAPRFPNTTLCQSARFRIYGCNARGDIVRELTGADSNAEIEWSVELANQKAAWYGFQLALDIPEANYAPPTTLRNPGVADRRRLAITPGARTVAGAESGPARFDGAVMEMRGYLGGITTAPEKGLPAMMDRGRR